MRVRFIQLNSLSVNIRRSLPFRLLLFPFNSAQKHGAGYSQSSIEQIAGVLGKIKGDFRHKWIEVLFEFANRCSANAALVRLWNQIHHKPSKQGKCQTVLLDQSDLMIVRVHDDPFILQDGLDALSFQHTDLVSCSGFNNIISGGDMSACGRS